MSKQFNREFSAVLPLWINYLQLVYRRRVRVIREWVRQRIRDRDSDGWRRTVLRLFHQRLAVFIRLPHVKFMPVSGHRVQYLGIHAATWKCSARMENCCIVIYKWINTHIADYEFWLKKYSLIYSRTSWRRFTLETP